MAIGDSYRLSCVWRSATTNKVAVNNFHFIATLDPVFDTQEEDLYERFFAEVAGPYVNLVTGLLTLDKIAIGVGPGFETTFVRDGLGQGGQVGGDAMPPRNAGVLSYSTNVLSRRGRGRFFLPPTGESMNAAGRPNATYLTAEQTLIDALVGMGTGGILTGNYDVAMYSEADAVTRAITSFTRRRFWGSQRDRGQLY